MAVMWSAVSARPMTSVFLLSSGNSVRARKNGFPRRMPTRLLNRVLSMALTGPNRLRLVPPMRLRRAAPRYAARSVRPIALVNLLNALILSMPNLNVSVWLLLVPTRVIIDRVVRGPSPHARTMFTLCPVYNRVAVVLTLWSLLATRTTPTGRLDADRGRTRGERGELLWQ